MKNVHILRAFLRTAILTIVIAIIANVYYTMRCPIWAMIRNTRTTIIVLAIIAMVLGIIEITMELIIKRNGSK